MQSRYQTVEKGEMEILQYSFCCFYSLALSVLMKLNCAAFFFLANGGFPSFWVGLIHLGAERSRVKPLWPSGGSISVLNFRFLKRGEPGIDTRTSNSGRERKSGPDYALINKVSTKEFLLKHLKLEEKKIKIKIHK